MSITKTYNRTGRKDVVTSPKTANSVRTVTLPPFLVDSMKDYISRNYEMEANDRLFPFTLRPLESSMRNACTASGIKKDTYT